MSSRKFWVLKKTQTPSNPWLRKVIQTCWASSPFIHNADFANFVVKEIVEQTVGGQVSKTTIDKQLQKHFIGKMQNVQWHYYLN